MPNPVKKNILIAEDERPMARALELKLLNSGFNAKAVYDGEEAIKELSSNKYDLVLLDIMMPKKDGFGVLEEMKNQKIIVPVIVSSNLSQHEDLEKAKTYGVAGYFVKSDTPISEVVNQVKKVLKIK